MSIDLVCMLNWIFGSWLVDGVVRFEPSGSLCWEN